MTIKDRQRDMWDKQDRQARRVDWMRVAELEQGLYGEVLSPEAQRVWKIRQDTAKQWRAWEQEQVAVTGGLDPGAAVPRVALGGVYGLPEPPRAPVILPYEPANLMKKGATRRASLWLRWRAWELEQGFTPGCACKRHPSGDGWSVMCGNRKAVSGNINRECQYNPDWDRLDLAEWTINFTRGSGSAPAYGKPLTPEQARDAVAVAHKRRIDRNSPPDDWQHGPPWERAIWNAFYHSDQAVANLLEATAGLRATMDHMTAGDCVSARRARLMWQATVALMLSVVMVIVVLAATV